ncbi:MAG: antibiotic biosynthesis monooxygenase [Lentisphaerales bacterium]|nr:antibiotic biosynthesis monooxygenase [Lentisphaerales bacterium]
MNLTVVAKVVAKEGNSEAVGAELYKLIEPTLQEEGCINYDLHQSIEDENIFIFHENWTSEAHLDAHLATEHIANCQMAIAELIESAEVHRLYNKA